MAIGTPPIQDGDDGPVRPVWATWFTSIRRALGGWSQTLTGVVVFDFGAIAGHAVATTTLTVTGASIGDVCVVTGNPATAGVLYTADCTATDTITIRANNYTAGVIDPASTSFRVIVFRQ